MAGFFSSLWPPSGIPVLMYHGVAPDRADRPPQMTHWMTPALLEEQLVALRRRGVETLFLGELREIVMGRRSMPRRAVVLTFDDGYLDFWLWVYPLLQKYGAKATVFVSLDFVDGDTPPRRLPDDFPWGFLSWPELAEMESSGLVDVQSHAVTHTWYPTGPRLLDVHRPGLPWSLLRSVWWNRYPDRKPLWYAEGSHDDVPFGLPVLENEKALLARRYFLNPAVEKRMIDFAAREGDGFFARAGWFDRYREAYRDACTELGDRAGAWESEAERLSRITDELRRSREEIGKRLEKDVRFLCCPGGSLNSEVFTIAREVGYDAVSIPSWFERGWNRPGGDAARFYRTGTGSLFRRVRSDRADALSTAVHVGAILGRPGDRFAWVALRAARRLRLI